MKKSFWENFFAILTGVSGVLFIVFILLSMIYNDSLTLLPGIIGFGVLFLASLDILLHRLPND